jgi:cell division protease FtsH
MVKQFGMSEKLGYVTFEKEKGPLFLPSPFSSAREYSEDTAKQIDEEVKKIIDESHQKIKEILTVKRDKLEELARFLMEKEVVEEEDLKRILQLEVAKA